MFDIVSDLHFDNGMHAAPAGMLRNIDVLRYKTPEARMLLVGGDTAERVSDMVDFLNGAAGHYEHVVAILGNHEKPDAHAPLAGNAVVLDWFGNQVRYGGVVIVGGCPLDEAATERIVRNFQVAQVDDTVERVVLLVHYVPSLRISKLIGRDIDNKCVRLLERLTFVRKPTLLVFGHVHLWLKGEIDGMRFLSNPRGYRGRLRDRTSWTGRFQFEA